jgi:hypothetical protein
MYTAQLRWDTVILEYQYSMYKAGTQVEQYR